MVCIPKKRCIECGSCDDLYHHHIIPESLGGTATVCLCGRCHGKVHDRSFERTSEPTRAGLAIARERGTRLGAPNMVEVRRGKKIIVDVEKLKLVSLVQLLKTNDISQQRLVDFLNAKGVKSPLKGKWHLRTIQIALKIDLSKYDTPNIETVGELHQDYYSPTD